MSDERAASCPICGATDRLWPALEGKDRLLGTPGRFEVVICGSCGAGRTLPVVGDSELGRYYTSEYQAHNLDARGAFAAAWRLGQRLRWAREFRSWPLRLLEDRPGTALDVGCGRGDLGAELIARGWTVAGLDPSPQAVDVARSRGIYARVGLVQGSDLESGTYDVATMIHSLEHVNDPVGDLRGILGALKPGGRLLALMPNFGAWQRQRMGSLWFHLDVPRHRTHFTKSSLALALATAGFVDIEVDDVFDAGALGGTLQYRWFDRVVADSGWRSAAWVAGSQVLSPLLRGLDAVAGESDILGVSARRPASLSRATGSGSCG